MGKFRGFLESQLLKQDFSHMGIEDRLKQGRDIGEKFIKDELLKHGVNVVTVGGQQNQDKYLKIDGYLNGQPSEPVQLKLRKTSRGGGDDIAYELILRYDPWMSITEQLKNPRNQGRDYKGTTVKHYFVLNQSETEIYHVPAVSLKNAALGAIKENGNVFLYDQPFRSSIGVELRATKDNSTGGDKLMAFIPAEKVATERYTVGQGQIKPIAGGNQMSKKDFNVAAAQDRLKALQAKQKLANDLRKRGFRGTDDQVIAQSGQAVA